MASNPARLIGSGVRGASGAVILLIVGLTVACSDDPSPSPPAPASSPPTAAQFPATTAGTLAPAARGIDASAALTVSYRGEERAIEFTQDRASAGTFYPGDPPRVEFAARSALDVFGLTGPMRLGVQPTSEELVLTLEVTFGDEFVFLYSSNGECSVSAGQLDPARVEGTVECDTSFDDQPLSVSGNFEATGR